jgi:hypothetical protein
MYCPMRIRAALIVALALSVLLSGCLGGKMSAEELEAFMTTGPAGGFTEPRYTDFECRAGSDVDSAWDYVCTFYQPEIAQHRKIGWNVSSDHPHERNWDGRHRPAAPGSSWVLGRPRLRTEPPAAEKGHLSPSLRWTHG